MKKAITAGIGTLALAAGIGLAACGGGYSSTAPGAPAGHMPATHTAVPKAPAGQPPGDATAAPNANATAEVANQTEYGAALCSTSTPDNFDNLAQLIKTLQQQNVNTATGESNIQTIAENFRDQEGTVLSNDGDNLWADTGDNGSSYNAAAVNADVAKLVQDCP
jgi:hypothetical protein